MKRVPPLLTVVMLVTWLLLNGTLAPGQVLLGAAIALALVLAASRWRPVHPRLRSLRPALPLLLHVLADVLRSNVAVARIVLGLAGGRTVHSGFIDVPLELRDPHGLAILAAIVTSTPGTAWAGVSADGSRLRLHVLDLRDEAGWVRTIKERYERPLLEIFR